MQPMACFWTRVVLPLSMTLLVGGSSVASPSLQVAGASGDAAEAAAGDDETEAEGAVADVKRIPVPSPDEAEDSQYTMEVPLTWNVRHDLPVPGILLGPPAGNPESHPEMVLVRKSAVSVSDPDPVLEALTANALQQDWKLVEAEVRDFGGVEGLWIVRELPPSGLHGSRVNVAVKLPLGAESLDLVSTVPEERFAELGPLVRQVLGSVRATPDPTSPE